MGGAPQQTTRGKVELPPSTGRNATGPVAAVQGAEQPQQLAA